MAHLGGSGSGIFHEVVIKTLAGAGVSEGLTGLEGPLARWLLAGLRSSPLRPLQSAAHDRVFGFP